MSAKETMPGVDDAAILPRSLRRAVTAVVGVLLAVATYLLVVRGPAIVFDLAKAAVFCF